MKLNVAKVKTTPQGRLAKTNGTYEKVRKRKRELLKLTPEIVEQYKHSADFGGTLRDVVPTCKQRLERLQEICVNTLLHQTPEKITLVQQALLQVAYSKPEHLLQFAAKILPKNLTLDTKPAPAPIVIDRIQINNISAPASASSASSPSTNPNPQIDDLLTPEPASVQVQPETPLLTGPKLTGPKLANLA